MSTKRKIIVDCDAGTDDAGAIMMALAYQHVEVVAVTCVFGNTEVENVVNNVLRVLKLCGRLDVSKTFNVFFAGSASRFWKTMNFLAWMGKAKRRKDFFFHMRISQLVRATLR